MTVVDALDISINVIVGRFVRQHAEKVKIHYSTFHDADCSQKSLLPESAIFSPGESQFCPECGAELYRPYRKISEAVDLDAHALNGHPIDEAYPDVVVVRANDHAGMGFLFSADPNFDDETYIVGLNIGAGAVYPNEGVTFEAIGEYVAKALEANGFSSEDWGPVGLFVDATMF